MCQPEDGQCPCKTGFGGIFCETCSPGYTNVTAGCHGKILEGKQVISEFFFKNASAMNKGLRIRIARRRPANVPAKKASLD